MCVYVVCIHVKGEVTSYEHSMSSKYIPLGNKYSPLYSTLEYGGLCTQTVLKQYIFYEHMEVVRVYEVAGGGTPVLMSRCVKMCV